MPKVPGIPGQGSTAADPAEQLARRKAAADRSAALRGEAIKGLQRQLTGLRNEFAKVDPKKQEAVDALLSKFQSVLKAYDVMLTPPTSPILSVSNSPVTYNAKEQEAKVSGYVPGKISNIKYNGSSTAPTNAATYAVTADFAPTDTSNYNSITGASAGIFVIEKAVATLSAANSPVTYNGKEQPAKVSGSVEGKVSNVKYKDSSTVPTNAGTYAVTADFAPSDTTNYNSLTEVSAGIFVIEKAVATLSAANSPVTYNGKEQEAKVNGSVAGKVTNVKYNGSPAVPTNAATYAVTADFAPTDTSNYNSITGASAGIFVIEKAVATLSAANSPVTYNGKEQPAKVSGSVAGTASNVKYKDSSTVPTDAGTYAVTADFAPSDTTNYNNLTGAPAGNFVIQKPTP